jgi:hypothetical protein
MRPSISERNFNPNSREVESFCIGLSGMTLGANIDKPVIGGGGAAIVNDHEESEGSGVPVSSVM